MTKRSFDVVGSAFLLLLAAPVMAVIALVLRVALGRPVFFLQPRAGLNGRPFTLCKFRTMEPERAAKGESLDEGGRLTAVGRFLRAASLDELPELFNVLRGDMSLVGPRPLLMEYLEHYTPEQARRHEVRPGITGWAQVSGRNALTWEDKFRLDVWYVDHGNLMLDLKILAKTVVTVLRREGIAPEGEATMPRFRG